MLYLLTTHTTCYASGNKKDNAIPLTTHIQYFVHSLLVAQTKQCYTSGKIQKKYITPFSTEPQAYCLCLIVICIACLFDWWARRGMCVCMWSCWTQFLSLKHDFMLHILSSCQMFWCDIYHVLWWVTKQISEYKLKIVVLHHIVTHTYMYNMNIYTVHPSSPPPPAEKQH